MFMEGVITAIHGDGVEIEFSGGLPNINVLWAIEICLELKGCRHYG